MYRFSFSLFLLIPPYSPAQLIQSQLNFVVYIRVLCGIFSLSILCAASESRWGSPALLMRGDGKRVLGETEKAVQSI